MKLQTKLKQKTLGRSLLWSSWISEAWLVVIPILGVTLGLMNRLIHQVHDINTFLWARAVYELMTKGVWYPQWLSQLWYGFGLPVLYFYPPLFYNLAGWLQLIGLPTVLAIKVILVGSTIVGGVFAYLWAKEWMNRTTALLVSGLWLLSPYYLSLIYVRGAFPEFVALNFIPMLLWFTARYWHSAKPKYWLGVVASTTLILLTHNLTTIVALMVYLAYVGYLFIEHRNSKLLMHSLTAVFATGLLTSFYWLPMLAYHGVINTKILTSGGFYYGNNFPELTQLLNLGLKHEIGWLTLGVIPTVILVLGWLTQNEILNRQLRSRLLFSLILASCFVILVIPYASFVWDWIPVLAVFQFPARFLGITCLFLAVTAGLIIDSFIENKIVRLRIIVGVVVMAGAMAIPFAVPRYSADRDRLGLDSANLNIFSYIQNIAHQASTNPWDKTFSFDRGVVSYEYLPRHISQSDSSNLFNATLAKFVHTDSTTDQQTLDVPALLSVNRQSTTLTTVLDTPYYSKFIIVTSESEKLLINRFEFPTWRFLLNGTPVTPTVKPEEPGQFLELPIGKNVLEIRLINTAPIQWGYWLSLGGLLFTISYLILNKQPSLKSSSLKQKHSNEPLAV